MAVVSLAPKLPEASIGDLIHTTSSVSSATLVPAVVRMLEVTPDLDGLVVLDPDGRIATIRRAHLFGQLHGRYGYALYERAPIWQLAEYDPLIVEATARPVDVIETALGRDAGRIYDDIVVAEDGRYVGAVSMRLLMVHGKDLLVSSLASRSVLEGRNRKLDELNRLQREFVANMTHELRSPLNTIMAIARLFIDGDDLSAEHRLDAQVLLSRGSDLLGIVNNLLDLHKLEAAQMVPVLATVDLPALLKEALESCRFLVEAKPIELVLALGDLPGDFATDDFLLRRILTNLLSNAVKFTERGSVRLAAHHDAGGLRIQVTDTGVGIHGADMARLFKKFEQLEPGKLHRHGGTGLGLVIVKQMAHLLGATVSVESAPGVGTTFTTRFGAAPGRASMAPARSPS